MTSFKSMVLAISLILFSVTTLADTSPTNTVISSINETININMASVEELASLKGVGQVKAHAIVSYREAHGEFDSLEDLLNVKGIGTKVLADNKARLSL